MSVSTTTFSERLKRIEDIREKTKGQVILHVGAQEVSVRSVGEVVRPSRLRELVQGLLYSLNLVWAFLIGIIAVALMVAVQARVFPLPNAAALFADSQLIISLSAGMCCAYVIRWALRLRGRSLNVVQFVAVSFAICSLHNLAFWMPEVSAVLFTREWVQLQQAAASPDTLVIRGKVFDFGV